MSTHSEETGAADVYGRLSDGKTAAAQEVRVTLGTIGLEIVETGGGTTRHWPYAGLEAAEPLSRRAVDALLKSPADAGMTLFVPGASFVRALVSRAPHLSARASRWSHAWPWIAAAAAVAATAIALVLLDISPSRTIATMLPDSVRQVLGTQSLQAMVGDHRSCHSAAGDRALARLTERLAAASDDKFKVIVVDWDLFNAFAVPGEQIVLTRGLLAKAGSPDEIAGVLAHEMGHGIARDPEAGLVRALGLSAMVELMTGGSSGTLANLGLALAQLSYTRGAERNADATALRLLKEARISAHGFGAFFDRVREVEGDSELNGLGGILRTHPATEERQKLVASQPNYPATPSLSEADWNSLRSICS
jgi:predicted Zn-dependent protease